MISTYLKIYQNWWIFIAILVLILSAEENMQQFWCIMLYYFKEGVKNNWNAKKMICAVYGEGTVTDRMCQKWFVKFLGTIDILAK